jgi:serine/threonine protein kinase
LKRAAGPFEILEILGEGSFGTVCVARVTGDPLRRRVALKILKGAYANNPKILNRTRDEARLLSRISHPNIVRVERLMDVGGRPVVVMEHVQGASLDQLLLRFKEGLPGSVALEVTRQTCLALHVAYNEALREDGNPLHVIHRDIKPSNILLSIHGEVKVVDFGIAKGEFEGREAETESVVMGSRPYMAPERLDGVSDDPTVDVYSAGMSMFELLCGRTMSLSINPVTHEQAMNRQLGYLHVEGMSEAGLEDLRGVLRRMCAYERNQRPSAIDSARDIEQCIYAIDPRYRVTLEEFARTTVNPIYESRPRIRPEDAVESSTDSDFLKEVTGQITGSTRTANDRRTSSWTPYVFLMVMGALVVILGSLATLKFLSETAPFAGLGSGATNGTPELEDGRVQIKVWIPADAQAKVGDVYLRTSGQVRVKPGPTDFDINFTQGVPLKCPFIAEEGIAVRYVGDGVLSVNDEAGQPCTPITLPGVTP